jgi:hypothetical protein
MRERKKKWPRLGAPFEPAGLGRIHATPWKTAASRASASIIIGPVRIAPHRRLDPSKLRLTAAFDTVGLCMAVTSKDTLSTQIIRGTCRTTSRSAYTRLFHGRNSFEGRTTIEIESIMERAG